MGDRYVQHVTLDTGDVRRSPRSEVRDDIVEMLDGWIGRMLAGETVQAGDVGIALTAQSRGRCLLIEVADSRSLDPLATIGVGTHSRCGSPLWRELHADARGTATSPDRPPPEPWVAARLRPDLQQHLGVAEILGDLERCLAWAWIERRPPGRE
ncbi:MAG: hypothetical protein RJA99_4250 [Pseudomonadota bacterium]